MYEKYGDDVTIVGVAGRDELDAIVSFVEDLKVDQFPHVVDESGALWREFGVTGQPFFYFINDDGTAQGYLGAMGVEGMSEQLEMLLAS